MRRRFGYCAETLAAIALRDLPDLRARLDALSRALENVRELVVSRRSRFDGETAEDLLRFCREGGIEEATLSRRGR